MRIIAVPGIWYFARQYAGLERRLKDAFLEQFPDATFTMKYLWYHPWQGKKMRQFEEDLIAEFDTGGDVVLVGYSMGGIISCAIAPRFKKSNVRGVITIYAPHRYLWGFFSRMLGSKALNGIPVASFAAKIDLMVPCGARHPQAVAHTWLWSDHLYALLWSSKPAKAFAAAAKKYF